MSFQNEFTYRVGRIGKQWGLGEPAGRVWGTLLFNSRPLTQKEIAKQCNYSLGLVSQSLKILEHLGMITTIGRKGRQKLYSAVVSFIDSFEKLLRNFMETEIQPIITLLSSNVEKVKDEEIRSRLDALIKDYKKMDLLLAFFSKVLATKKLLSFSTLKKLTEDFTKKLEI